MKAATSLFHLAQEPPSVFAKPVNPADRKKGWEDILTSALGSIFISHGLL